ncbi:MAG TPA: peroxiredoxin [Dongiaceae bacterium]|nr:peroxiredoxin [Dongiaceae bacterium]
MKGPYTVKLALLLALAFMASFTLPATAYSEAKWVGSTAPVIALPDQDGKQRSLADYKGQWVALYFYPRDKTSGCTEEAKNFGAHWSDYQKANVAVLGVSQDSVASHKEFATLLKLPFSLLSDEKGEFSKAMGVNRGFGPLSYASRQTFLIDPDGTVVYHYPDVDTETHAAQVLADVARLSAKP